MELITEVRERRTRRQSLELEAPITPPNQASNQTYGL
jgi:hypothetical protein